MRTGAHEAYDGAAGQSTAADLVVHFTARLRAAGLSVSTGETLDAVRALLAVDLVRRDAVRAALRCTLLRAHGHEGLFDRIFDELLATPARPARTAGSATPGDAGEFQQALAEALADSDTGRVHELADAAVDRWGGIDANGSTARHHAHRVLRALDLDAVLRALLNAAAARGDLDRSVARARAIEDLGDLRQLLERLAAERLPRQPTPRRKDLDDLPILRASPDELAALRAAVRPLARRLAARLGRRHRRGAGQLDMRRTIRRSISTGGVAMDPVTRRRARTRPDLVVLCDVSGSVATFAPFTLALLHALHDEFPRVRSWVFVDGIVEITEVLAQSRGVLDANHLLARRGLVTGDGRSDYRRALLTFLDRWRDAVTPRTTVLVVGDARSHEHPPALAELTELDHLARRLYWFDPEPRRDWDADDSRIADYATRCTAVFEVATLRQLEACVARIAGEGVT